MGKSYKKYKGENDKSKNSKKSRFRDDDFNPDRTYKFKKQRDK